MAVFKHIDPLFFHPVHQNYVWGGESWEISDRSEGMSIVSNGPLKGKALHELLEIVGRSCSAFPLLIKIIDAKENLSIQVHPDETSGPLFNGEPKTEMWIALKKSTVFAGLKRGTTREMLEEAIQNQTAEQLLVKRALERGEALFIPGGRVHAVCGDSLLLEIQQNSNTTYRLYDWGRTGRPLHLREGFAAIRWGEPELKKSIPRLLAEDAHHRLDSLESCPFFAVERLHVFDRWAVPHTPTTFQIFFCVEGEGRIQAELLRPGRTCLVPAAARDFAIAGRCQLIRVFLP